MKIPASLCLLLALTGVAQAQGLEEDKDASWLLPMPELRADPKVPVLEKVVGHAWGQDISSHREIEAYVKALAEAAPDRCKLIKYGETYEKRALYYLVISSPENIARLEELRTNNLALSRPGSVSDEERKAILAKNPAFVWLAYSIHGNEISSSDAALVTAYHLVADQRPETRALLDKAVVFIDPLQNADGRDRFVNVFRETRGVFLDSEPNAREHTERWPNGRSNHYHFDMNRDWFRQSQRETRAKVAAYLRWQPHIFVDAHEMGRNSSYFFVPPMDPVNPFVLPTQKAWFLRIGRHQASRFDEHGFAYTTREIFDAFYPGYGSEWPTMQGGIGVLWEQASARGLVIDRDDQRKLRYCDGVRHHYVSGIATVEVAARNRERLVADFAIARRRGIELGREGKVRHFFLTEGSRPERAAELARVLKRNGIEVRRLTSAASVVCTDTRDEHRRRRELPAGTYHLPVAQPAGRLLRTLMDRHIPMNAEFVDEQLRRREQNLSAQIYDVTAWSLPLSFGVPCFAVEGDSDVQSARWGGLQAAGRVVGGPAKVAYLLPGDDDCAPKALAFWLRKGLRVHVLDKASKFGELSLPRGSFVVKIAENSARVHELVAEAAASFGAVIHATNTGFPDEGAHLGGPHIHWVRPPKVLLVMDRPTSYSSGHTWYHFDQVLRYPCTRVAGRSLGAVDLDRYNVLILPDGNYSGAQGPSKSVVKRLKAWVRDGGTLITLRRASLWAAEEEVGFLDTQRANAEFSSDKGSRPDGVPGAFLNSEVFEQHWLTYAYSLDLQVFFNGDVIFEPLKPSVGRNVVSFANREDLLASGFCWPQTLDYVAGKPYLLYQSHGSGHVVAFADDPNYRAMYPALQRLFTNAAMLGPAH